MTQWEQYFINQPFYQFNAFYYALYAIEVIQQGASHANNLKGHAILFKFSP